jgi:hypothetical protein
MRILIDLNDPLMIPDILLTMHKICIDEAEKFDPDKKLLKYGMYRVAALRLEYIAGNIKKRMITMVKEYE